MIAVALAAVVVVALAALAVQHLAHARELSYLTDLLDAERGERARLISAVVTDNPRDFSAVEQTRARVHEQVANADAGGEPLAVVRDLAAEALAAQRGDRPMPIGLGSS